jgi:DNA-binding GntR family transcriptional regulator
MPPSEREFCVTFGVSRINNRCALSMLQDHGLIKRFSGSAMFVREVRLHKLPILDGDYSGSTRGQAAGTTRLLLALESVEPPEQYRELFGFLKTEKRLKLEWLDQQGGAALSFDRGYIPLNLATTSNGAWRCRSASSIPGWISRAWNNRLYGVPPRRSRPTRSRCGGSSACGRPRCS